MPELKANPEILANALYSLAKAKKTRHLADYVMNALVQSKALYGALGIILETRGWIYQVDGQWKFAVREPRKRPVYKRLRRNKKRQCLVAKKPAKR